MFLNLEKNSPSSVPHCLSHTLTSLSHHPYWHHRPSLKIQTPITHHSWFKHPPLSLMIEPTSHHRPSLTMQVSTTAYLLSSSVVAVVPVKVSTTELCSIFFLCYCFFFIWDHKIRISWSKLWFLELILGIFFPEGFHYLFYGNLVISLII